MRFIGILNIIQIEEHKYYRRYHKQSEYYTERSFYHDLGLGTFSICLFQKYQESNINIVHGIEIVRFFDY